MHLIVVDFDEIYVALFNDKEKKLYKPWMEEYMKYVFPIYMKHLQDEGIEWISISAVNIGFMRWFNNELIDYDKMKFKQFDLDVTIYDNFRPMSCEQIIFLLHDHISEFYRLENEDERMLDNTFLKTY